MTRRRAPWRWPSSVRRARRWCSFRFHGSTMRRTRPATASGGCSRMARWNWPRRSRRARPLSPKARATTRATPTRCRRSTRRARSATLLTPRHSRPARVSPSGTMRCSTISRPTCRISGSSALGRIASGARAFGARRDGCCAATRRPGFPTSPPPSKMRMRRRRTRAFRCGRAWTPTCAGTIFFRSRSKTATSRFTSVRTLTTTAQRRISGSCSRRRLISRTACGGRR